MPADKFLTVNGLTIHYLDWGNASKPPFIMLHGISRTAHSFDSSWLSIFGVGSLALWLCLSGLWNLSCSLATVWAVGILESCRRPAQQAT